MAVQNWKSTVVSSEVMDLLGLEDSATWKHSIEIIVLLKTALYDNDDKVRASFLPFSSPHFPYNCSRIPIWHRWWGLTMDEHQ